MEQTEYCTYLPMKMEQTVLHLPAYEDGTDRVLHLPAYEDGTD